VSSKRLSHARKSVRKLQKGFIRAADKRVLGRLEPADALAAAGKLTFVGVKKRFVLSRRQYFPECCAVAGRQAPNLLLERHRLPAGTRPRARMAPAHDASLGSPLFVMISQTFSCDSRPLHVGIRKQDEVSISATAAPTNASRPTDTKSATASLAFARNSWLRSIAQLFRSSRATHTGHARSH